MERHCSNAQALAEWLEQHPRVESVIYPGLRSHPQQALAAKQMSAAGGMITAILRGDLEYTKRVLSRCRVFALAESLGGVESLIEHPAIMTHASVPEAQRKAAGISDTLVRISVGVEDPEDLKEDLDTALNAAG
jgi:cystathionine beta-lyase/cystathionine gamma-synthase